MHLVENISEILLNCVRTDRSDKLNKFTVRNRVCAVCTCAANGRHSAVVGRYEMKRNLIAFLDAGRFDLNLFLDVLTSTP